MLRKLLCLVMAALLLCACLSGALAVSPYMSPYIFSKNYDAAVDDWVQQLYGDSATEQELGELAELLKISYVEEENGIVYYDNEDWSIEANFYYEGGVVDIYEEATTANFAISTDAFNEDGIWLFRLILASTLADLESDADALALLRWMSSADEETEPMPLGDYYIHYVPIEGACHYAIVAH